MKKNFSKLFFSLSVLLFLGACATDKPSPARKSASNEDMLGSTAVMTSIAVPLSWPVITVMNEVHKEDIAIAREQGGKYILNSLQVGNSQLSVPNNSQLLRLLEIVNKAVEEKGSAQEREAWAAATNLQRVITVYRGLNEHSR